MGTAILATSPENRARITSSQTPDQIAAHRVRAPTDTFSAVWPTEPPTGMPRKNPEARLPAPWAMMSWSGLGRASPGFGAASATPAPWTRTIAATARAPVTRLNENSRTSGRWGSGMPRGMPPASPTRATLSAPARAITRVGMTRANSELTTASRVRASRARMASAPSPASSEARSIRLGWVSTLTAFANGNAPWAGAPVRSAIWPHTMLTEIPVRKPVITEYETNRVYRPSRATPAATSTTPVRMTSRATAAGRWAGGTLCRAEPAASAAADVVVMTISRVCELRPPAIGPAKPAYSPCTGLTPTSTAAAIPSGTLLIARGSPATISARRCARSGPMVRTQRPAAARDARMSCRTRLSSHRTVARSRRLAPGCPRSSARAAVPGSPAQGGGGRPGPA